LGLAAGNKDFEGVGTREALEGVFGLHGVLDLERGLVGLSRRSAMLSTVSLGGLKRLDFLTGEAATEVFDSFNGCRGLTKARRAKLEQGLSVTAGPRFSF
jgi:hypothetical protein